MNPQTRDKHKSFENNNIMTSIIGKKIFMPAGIFDNLTKELESFSQKLTEQIVIKPSRIFENSLTSLLQPNRVKSDSGSITIDIKAMKVQTGQNYSKNRF